MSDFKLNKAIMTATWGWCQHQMQYQGHTYIVFTCNHTITLENHEPKEGNPPKSSSSTYLESRDF